MYAVIRTGGKQYRVTAGSILEVERLDVAAGDTVKIAEVLALSGDKQIIGAPLVEGAHVEAQVLAQEKSDKVLVFKKKRRHNYKRKNGHRQQITVLHILNIVLNGKSVVSVEPRQPRKKTGASGAKKPAAVARTKAAAPAQPKKKPAGGGAKKPAAKKAAK